MCTIAGTKVHLNYNCYNVYFYECLRLSQETNLYFKIKLERNFIRSYALITNEIIN